MSNLGPAQREQDYPADNPVDFKYFSNNKIIINSLNSLMINIMNIYLRAVKVHGAIPQRQCPRLIRCETSTDAAISTRTTFTSTGSVQAVLLAQIVVQSICFFL